LLVKKFICIKVEYLLLLCRFVVVLYVSCCCCIVMLLLLFVSVVVVVRISFYECIVLLFYRLWFVFLGIVFCYYYLLCIM